MEFIGALIILGVICFIFWLIYIIVETNQIAKRNYEKLDKIMNLLQKNNNDDINNPTE